MSGVEQQTKAAMQAALDHLKAELKSLRTGRANSSMLDKVQVDVYGSLCRLRDIAQINVPESRQIVVMPFDISQAKAIAKAIEEMANFQATVDGKLIRVNVPAMDESLRKQMAKTCKEHGEKSKIVVREIRRKFNDLVKKQKQDGEIPEDMQKKLEKGIQELTDRFCKEIDVACQEKEKEILTV
jgi:ribosome recycling factor